MMMFIDFAKTDFNCPHCKKKYEDKNDMYVKKCNKNKNGMTKIACDCGKPFFMTYNYRGNAVAFLE